MKLFKDKEIIKNKKPIKEKKIKKAEKLKISKTKSKITFKEVFSKDFIPRCKDKVKRNQEQRKKAEEIKREMGKLIDEWSEVMTETGSYNKMKLIMTPRHIKNEDYGWSGRVYSPYGIPLEKLETLTPAIESGLKCKFLYDIPQHKQFAIVKFVYPEKVKINEWEFNPVKVNPWEFCPGYDVSGEPIKFNINDTPQILVAGQQRRGKNGATDHAIISWIHSCDETEITFYMFQCAKNDLIKYKDCVQVYCYAETLDKILIALEHIEKELERRTSLFESMVSKADGNDNIFHYNKLNPRKKLPYIIVVIDEFIELMPDNSIDDKLIKEKKNKIMKHIRQIGQFGGSMGINYCVLHQKPSKEYMPGFTKNQSSIRLCFGFDDLVCCAIVLSDELAKYAHKLPPRKAYYSNNEKNGYLYTSNLKGRIRMFLEPSIKPNHRTLFDDLEKLKKSKEEEIKVKNNSAEENSNQNTSENKGTAPIPTKKKLKITKVEKENIGKEIIQEIIEKPKESPKEDIKIEDIKINLPQIPLDFSKVDPRVAIDKDALLEKSTKKIKDYVPYKPSENVVVIDKTLINLSETEKPKIKTK